jgi:uncharacterized damage-inducible protein DinB
MKEIIEIPPASEYPTYFQRYINLIENRPLIDLLHENLDTMCTTLEHISGDKGDYSYAPDKWTIKEVLNHIMDAERIFAYRGLCISRKEKNPLRSYDHTSYAAASNVSHVSLEAMIEEFKALRISTITMFKNMNGEMLTQIGNVDKNPMSSRATGYIIVAHAEHHLQVLRNKYGV